VLQIPFEVTRRDHLLMIPCCLHIRMERMEGCLYIPEAAMGILLLRMVLFMALLHPWIAWLGILYLLHKFYILFPQQKPETGMKISVTTLAEPKKIEYSEFNYIKVIICSLTSQRK
jgi:hypothetical protein